MKLDALKPSSGSLSCKARNSKDLSLLKIRRAWCVIEEGLLSSLVDPLVCVPSSDWQLGIGVCVGGDRIHLLSAWLYMVCFVSATVGQQWHIEVFISRKQVAEERDELVRISWFPSLSVCYCAVPTLYCMHIMECVHVSAPVCVNVRSYISVCVIFGGLLQRRINQWCLG